MCRECMHIQQEPHQTKVWDVNMYARSTCVWYTCDSLECVALCIVPGQGGERSRWFQGLIHHYTVIALVMQSNCKPGFTGQLKWVYSCLVSGSWKKQPMNSAQNSCCFGVVEAAPQASFPVSSSLRMELGDSWNNLCIHSTKHWDPLRPSVDLSMFKLIVGEVLLAYKSSPTQREQVPPHCLSLPCSEQHGLWRVCVLHCWGGCNAMTPPEVLHHTCSTE